MIRLTITIGFLALIATCSSPMDKSREATAPIQGAQSNNNRESDARKPEKITEVTPILGSIAFGPNELGFIGGSDQHVWVTTDGGKSWSKQRVPYEAAKESGLGWFDFVKAAISTSGTIHAIGHLEEAGTAVFTSVDAGKSWKDITYESSTLNDIAVAGDDFWIAGTIRGSGVVLKSTGQQKWQVVSKDLTRYLAGIFFLDSNSGWTVGAEGVILNTSDGGHTWKRQVSATQVMLTSVFFANASKGLIVGDQGTILQTNDGGLTWTKSQSNTQADLTRVVMITPDEACVVGSKGTVLVTSNGGRNWSSPPIESKSDIYALTRKDNYYWIGISDGTVFRLLAR